VACRPVESFIFAVILQEQFPGTPEAVVTLDGDTATGKDCGIQLRMCNLGLNIEDDIEDIQVEYNVVEEKEIDIFSGSIDAGFRSLLLHLETVTNNNLTSKFWGFQGGKADRYQWTTKIQNIRKE
jgi:hypothetical protein